MCWYSRVTPDTTQRRMEANIDLTNTCSKKKTFKILKEKKKLGHKKKYTRTDLRKSQNFILFVVNILYKLFNWIKSKL